MKVKPVIDNQEKEILKLYRSLKAKNKDVLVCFKMQALPKYSCKTYLFVPEATVRRWNEGWKVK